MKYVFITLLLILGALYAAAELTLVRSDQPEMIYLRWATDPSPVRRDQVKPFEAMNPNIKIIVDPGMGNDQTKLIVQCATGVGPDVIDVDNIASMAGLVEAGILLDLTPFAETMGFAPEDTYPQIRDALMYRGKQYRYPCNVYELSFLYNKAIFDECGIPYPTNNWTWADAIEIGKRVKQFKRAQGEPYIPVANVSSLALTIDLIIAHGGTFYRDGGLHSNLDSPEAIAALQLYSDLVFVHGVIPSKLEAQQYYSQGGWGDGGANWFAAQRASTLVLGRWFTGLIPTFPAIKGKLGAVTMPRLSADRPSIGRVDTRAAAINVKSKYREASLKFLQYLASEEYGRLIVETGEALPPNPKLAQSGADLVMPLEPDPAFHQVFVDQLQTARVMDISAFIDPQQVIIWLIEAIDRVESQNMTPEQALTGLAREVNEKIRLDLKRRTDLQERFTQATGTPYTPDWR